MILNTKTQFLVANSLLRSGLIFLCVVKVVIEKKHIINKNTLYVTRPLHPVYRYMYHARRLMVNLARRLYRSGNSEKHVLQGHKRIWRYCFSLYVILYVEMHHKMHHSAVGPCGPQNGPKNGPQSKIVLNHFSSWLGEWAPRWSGEFGSKKSILIKK